MRVSAQEREVFMALPWSIKTGFCARFCSGTIASCIVFLSVLATNPIPSLPSSRQEINSSPGH